ncbi:MAG: mannose-6-phosphate isomerase [Erysipelotrichia bacterium]|nr:mannose-6-phosphate isomerase [Erysipelotrichia bacterium]
MEIIKLKGVIKNYPWGGNRLEEYGKSSDDIMAESWELSVHQDGISVIDSGKYRGMNLKEYFKNNSEVLGNKNDLNIMIKYIDARSSLSIQVHPDDEYALIVEQDLGKTEMWYIMESLEGSYIYYGVNRKVSIDELRERIENNTILEVLNKVETKKGDYFLIEAGTIHAIGAGNIICEIQQNSNLTYRLYDFNRRDKFGNLRELHIDKALDVVKTVPSMRYKHDKESSNNNVICSCEYFEVEHYKGEHELVFNTDGDYQIINFLDGEGMIENLTYKKGDTFLVPANYGEYRVTGECEFLKTISNF